MGDFVSERVEDVTMKVLILLCAVVAVVSANAVPNTCQLSHNLVKKLANELSSHYPDAGPPDGVCEDGEGFQCVGEIATTVMDCIGLGLTDPASILKCVQEAINAGSSCYDCVCWVMSYLGWECPTA